MVHSSLLCCRLLPRILSTKSVFVQLSTSPVDIIVGCSSIYPNQPSSTYQSFCQIFDESQPQCLATWNGCHLWSQKIQLCPWSFPGTCILIFFYYWSYLWSGFAFSHHSALDISCQIYQPPPNKSIGYIKNFIKCNMVGIFLSYRLWISQRLVIFTLVWRKFQLLCPFLIFAHWPQYTYEEDC